MRIGEENMAAAIESVNIEMKEMAWRRHQPHHKRRKA
jgi:hypothetical protein